MLNFGSKSELRTYVMENWGDREAIALHLEDEDPVQFWLISKPSLAVTFELLPAYV